MQKHESDPHVLLASVSRYFKYNEPGLIYEFAYDPFYDHVVELLRKEGWNVQLRIATTRELYYAVCGRDEQAGCASVKKEKEIVPELAAEKNFHVGYFGILKSLSANNSANPEICLNLSNSSLSIPIFFIIHASLIPAFLNSATMLVISSIL